MMITHLGGCHCGRVRFEVIAPANLEVEECDCSVCSKAGFLHLIVPAERFKLLSGSDAITTYTFHTGVAKHLFCATCGVKSFYVPRSHPDGFSVNV
ncbi:MAG TPA: GFA family protein, partial [Steroidobacteraceae bacterium]